MTVIDTVRYVDTTDAADAEFDEATHTWAVAGRRIRIAIATDGALPAALACRVDGQRPYLGVAVHGVPNYFVITGPDTAAQKGYVAKCLAHMSRTGSSRIEVRPSAQRLYNERSPGGAHRSGRYWRRVGRRIPSAFEVRSHGFELDVDDAVYDGQAMVVIDDRNHEAHVRLTGRVDPVDGHYHWQGTIFDTGLDVRLPKDVMVTVGERTAAGRLTERTPWSTFSVTGQGAPPFALPSIEVDVPLV